MLTKTNLVHPLIDAGSRKGDFKNCIIGFNNLTKCFYHVLIMFIPSSHT